MSWLSIPLPNPFKSLHDDPQSPTSSSSSPSSPQQQQQSSSHGGGGVKEDFSLLSQTIGRQLRGVAAFLAPPPPPSSSSTEDNYADDLSPSSPSLSGIRNDLVEIGGSFKSGLSLLSSSKTVSEISRFASNLLQFRKDDDDDDDDEENRIQGYGGVAGITEEVVEFVKEISMRPECWTEFPLSLDNDFSMSDAQREHVSTIEHLAPSFAALRLELCNQMNDEHFWMIYFILLLPRLNEDDFNLLSSPEIVETRQILLQKLKKERNPQVNPERSDVVNSSQKCTQASKTQAENRSSLELLPRTVSATGGAVVDEEKNIEQRLEEKDVDIGPSLYAPKQLGNDENVSFSDLEDDDNDLSGKLSDFRPPHDMGNSSPTGSNEWVQLTDSSETRKTQQKASQISREKDSEGEESNDWLTIDDFDSDSVAAM